MSGEGVVLDYLANERNEVTMTKLMNEQEVKRKLHEIGPLKGFKVTFIKKDGTLRVIFGCMDVFYGPKGKDFKSSVPIIEESTGEFRSFSLNSVVSIEENFSG